MAQAPGGRRHLGWRSRPRHDQGTMHKADCPAPAKQRRTHGQGQRHADEATWMRPGPRGSGAPEGGAQAAGAPGRGEGTGAWSTQDRHVKKRRGAAEKRRTAGGAPQRRKRTRWSSRRGMGRDREGDRGRSPEGSDRQRGTDGQGSRRLPAGRGGRQRTNPGAARRPTPPGSGAASGRKGRAQSRGGVWAEGRQQPSRGKGRVTARKRRGVTHRGRGGRWPRQGRGDGTGSSSRRGKAASTPAGSRRGGAGRAEPHASHGSGQQTDPAGPQGPLA